MKLIRIFIAFIVVSLFFGIGSAFNGQSNPQNIVAENKTVEKNDKEKILNEESTEIVDNKKDKTAKEEISKTTNSFPESNQEKSTSSNKKNVNKSQTTNNSKTQENNKTNNPVNQTPPVEEKSKGSNSSPVVSESFVVDNSINDDKFNATYYSITKGNAEYETKSGCESAGLSIQNKELDSILDWNEEHPDEQKKPIIGSSMCISVMKNGKEYWFLHFLTTTKENLDSELKSLYK